MYVGVAFLLPIACKMCTVQTISMICSYLQTNNGYIFIYNLHSANDVTHLTAQDYITFSEVQYEM